MYAVHLSEVAAVGDWHPLRWLLAPFLTEETVMLSQKWDGVGVVVNTDVPGRDWEAAVQVALSAPMPDGYVIRIYKKELGAWKRLVPKKVAK